MWTPEAKASLMAGGLFFLVANPYTYDLTQALLGRFVSYTDSNGRPTQAGTLIHAGVFALLTYLIMRINQKRSGNNE
jgi:hypothetical protein